MRDLESLLERVVQHHVEFVLVGGFAAVAHGVTLLTEDIEICCPFDVENLRRLQRALSDLHPVHRLTPKRLPFELIAGPGDRIQNLYLDTDHGQIDCLESVLGVANYTKVREHSIVIELPFGLCRVLRIDALIRAKEAMNRARDKLAIIQLKAIQERVG